MHFLSTDTFIGQFILGPSAAFLLVYTRAGFTMVFQHFRCFCIKVKRKMRGKPNTTDLPNNKAVTLKLCSFPGKLKRIINPNLKDSD